MYKPTKTGKPAEVVVGPNSSRWRPITTLRTGKTTSLLSGILLSVLVVFFFGVFSFTRAISFTRVGMRTGTGTGTGTLANFVSNLGFNGDANGANTSGANGVNGTNTSGANGTNGTNTNSSLAPANSSKVYASTSSTLNFQARLTSSTGNIVPDGTYNIEFKLYNASTSSGSSQGTCTGDANCLWTENYTGASKVRIQNGYLSVYLGTQTALPTNISWDQNMYITMNIGGSGAATWDGEMTPRIQLSAVPYALASGQIAKFNGTQTGTLSFTTVANSPTIQLPDIAGTNNVLLQSGTTLFSQGSIPFTDSTGRLTQNNANLFYDNANSTLGVGTTRTGAINGTGNSRLVIQGAGSTSATSSLNIRNSSGAGSLFLVRDDGNVGIGTTVPSNKLHIVGPSVNSAYAAYIDSTFTTTGAGSAYGLRINNNQGTLLSLEGNGTPVLTVSTAAATDALTVTNTSNSNYTATFTNGPAAFGRVLHLVSGSVAANTPIFQADNNNGAVFGIYANGNVGIGTTTIGTNNRLIVNPYSTVDNLATAQINTNATTNKGLVIQGVASQTADLLQLQDSTGTVLGSFYTTASSGILKLNGGSGQVIAAYFADQAGTGAYIQTNAAGPIVVSSRTSTNIGLVVKGVASQSADLLQLQNSSGTVLSKFDSAGNFVFGSAASAAAPIHVEKAGTSTELIRLTQNNAGTISGLRIYDDSGVGGGTHIARVGATGPLYVGENYSAVGLGDASTSSVSVGGTFFELKPITNNGASKPSTILRLHSTDAGSLDRYTDIQRTVSGQVLITGASSTAATNVIGIRGVASQTGNLLELQDNNGLVNGAFNSSGAQLTLGRVAATGTVTPGKLLFADGTTDNFSSSIQSATQTANTIYQLPAAAAGTYDFCTTANNCTGLGAYINNTTTLQTSSNFAIQSAADASITGLIRARASQTADLLQFQNSAGTQPLSGINSSGQIYFRDSTSGFTSTISVTPGSLSASNKIVTLPNNGGEICTSAGNCIGNGGSGDVFKNGQTGPLVLGTNDAGGSNLSFITQNVTRATFDFANNLYLGNGATAGTPNNFVLQGTGSSTVGTAGALFSIKGGAGATATTGSAGGGLTLQGGDAGGTGVNNGGNVSINGGANTSTGSVGNVILQGTNGGNVGIGTTTPTSTFQTQGATLSSGATTMTAVNTQSTFTTSVSLTLNAGDYIIPTTTTGQARSVVTTSTGTTFTITPAFAAGVTGETFTIHRGIANLTNSSGTSALFAQGGTAFVGIGTKSPIRQLHVVSGSANTALFESPSTNYTGVGIQNSSTGGRLWNFIVAGQTPAGGDIGNLASGSFSIYDGTSGLNRIVVNSSGSVGLGTSVPNAKLSVNGNAIFGTGDNTASPGAGTIQGASVLAGTSNTSGADLTVAGGRGTGTGVGGNVLLQYAPAGATGSAINALVTACLISGTNGSFSCPGAGSTSERFGAGSLAAGINGVAVGNNASAGFNSSTVVGASATVSGTSSVSVGTSATASSSAVAIGSTSTASGLNSIAIGGASSSTANNAISIGQSTSNAFAAAIAIGKNATTTVANQLVIGGPSSGSTQISNAYFGSGVTDATPTNFVLQGTGSSTAGTAGALFTVKGGAGATATTGSAGGGLTLQGGDAGGSGVNNGGDVSINGGAKTSTGTVGNVILQGANGGNVGIGTTTPGEKLTLANNTFLGGVNAAASASVKLIGLTSADDIQVGNNTNYIKLYTSSAERVRILDYGIQVNTGFTSPTTPGYSWIGDSTTGIFRPAASTIGFSTGGTEQVRITSAGKLGIGTTLPTGDLSFGGDVARTIKLEANTANAAGNNLTISAGAAGAGAAAFTGGTLNLQGGAAGGTGNANGANVSIQGGAGTGTGVQGLVTLASSSFTASATETSAVSFTLAQSKVDNNSTIPVNATASSLTVTVPAPTQNVVGRLLYITAVSGSNTFTLAPSGGTSFTMNANTTATLIWNGTVWTNAGVDGGSSSYIQNQNASTQTANFRISGVGQAAGFDINTTGTLNIGAGTTAGQVATAIQLGNDTNNSALTLSSGTGAINIGTGAQARNVNIATGSAVQALTLGSTNSTSTTVLQGGNGTSAININTATGGTINVGNGAVANTLQIGNTTGAVAQTINIGNNTTASSATTLVVGSTIGTSPVTLQSGTSGVLVKGANSTTAFQIQNAAGTSVLNVDTVNSITTVSNVNELATLGSEKVTNGTFTGNATGWILGAGWAYNVNNVTKTAGTASDLEQNVSAVVGESYRVAFVISSYSAGCLTPEIGGNSGQPICSGSTQVQTFISVPSTGNLKLKADSSFVGNVDNVSVTKITLSSPVLKVNNLEVRSGGFGYYNSFIGESAGQANVSGVGDTALGYYALGRNTTGSNNNAFGAGALGSNTTGNNSSAFGNSALTANTTGSNNTAFGNSALSVNTTGSSNVGLGGAALGANTIGSSNVGLGGAALGANTIGSGNIGLGGAALRSNTTGDNNLAIGFQASYIDPSVIGFVSLTNLTNTTTIGYGSQVQNSNSLILGGQGANQANVGIGTTIPTNLFSVSPVQYSTGAAGTGGVSSSTVTGVGTLWLANATVGSEIIFANGNSATTPQKATITAIASDTSMTVSPAVTVAAGTVYRIHRAVLQVTSGGNVGIGTTTPSAPLSVGSTSQFQVSALGAVTAVGVNSGTGLLQGSGGLTVTGNITLGSSAASTAASTVRIADTSDATGTQLVTIGSGANAANSVTLQAGASGGINLNSASIATNATTLALFNTNATTVTALQAATSLSIGATTGTLTVRNANQTFGNAAGSGVFTNNGATVNTTLAVANDSDGGALGGTPASPLTAAQSVDVYTSVSIAQTTAGQTITLPTPTANTAYGRILYISNIGTASFTLLGSTLNPGSTATLIWSNTNGAASWQYAGADGNGILNQNTSDQTANFRISGVGQAAGFDINATGTLNIGTGTTAGQVATAIQIGNDTNNSALTLSSGTGAINIGTGAQARTVNIATGSAAQAVTLGSNNTTSTTTINGGTGATAVTINTGSGGTLSLGNSGVANTIQVGNTTGAFLQTISLGTNATASSTNTINIGNAATSTTNLNLGSTSANTTTQLQGNTVTILGGTSATAVGINVGAAGTLSIGTAANAQTINIGSTTTGTGIAERVGTGNYSLDGVASSTYNFGASTTTGTIAIGGTAQTGTLTLGSSTGTQSVLIGNGTGASTVNIANNVAIATGNTVNIAGGATATGLTDTVNIGTGNTVGTGAKVINIGTGVLSGNNSITIGTVNNASTTTIRGGTGATALALQSGAGGTITIGATAASTLNIGTGAFAHTIAIGNDGTTTQGITIGSTSASSTTLIQGGTGASAISLQAGAGGTVSVGASAGSGSTLLNNGSTVNATLAKTDFATGGSIGSAATTVDIYTAVSIAQTTTLQTLTIPTPTANTAYGRILYISNIGTASFTLLGSTLNPGSTATLIWSNTNGAASWQYAGADGNAILNQNATNQTANYRITGTGQANTSFLTPLLDTPSGTTTLNIGTTNASAGINLNQSTVIAANKDLIINTGTGVFSQTFSGTTQTPYTLSSTFAPSGGGTQTNSKLLITNSPTGSANTLYGQSISLTETSNLATTLQGQRIRFTDAGTGTGTKTGLDIDVTTANANDTTYAAVFNGGSVGIGTTSPVATFDTRGTAQFRNLTDSSTAFVIQNATGANSLTVDNTGSTANLAVNGAAENTFGTEWAAQGASTVTRDVTATEFASGVAGVKAATGAVANQGVKNNLGAALSNTGTQPYVVSFSVKTSVAITNANLSVIYQRDGATTDATCSSFTGASNALVNTTSFIKYTCTIIPSVTAGTSAAAIAIVQLDAVARNIFIDNLSVVIQNSTGTQNTNVLRVGGASSQGLTLLTLDTNAGTPFTGTNTALAGSLYFDTISGKIQCYDGTIWGACGAAPNNIITLSPEYANAVLHGNGIGTLTSDICSDDLNINDGSGAPAQPTICNAAQTYNYYQWTSPQATPQLYSIYVTYQLPSTFKGFVGGQTSLVGRTDSTNSTITYNVYRNRGGTLVQCGTAVAVSTGAQTNWQTGTAGGNATNNSDPASCITSTVANAFVAGDSIVFKIDVTASNGANAYVSNFNFQFSNK